MAGSFAMSSTAPSQNDFDLSSAALHTISVSGKIDLRIYSDTRPHNLKIAELQKGMVLVLDGKEVVSEGAGLGLPILVYSNETYFSGTSRVFFSKHRDCSIVRKEFEMDRITRNKFRHVTLENRNIRKFFSYLAYLYQRYPRLRFLKVKSLTKAMHVNSVFVKVPAIGKTLVTYLIKEGHIQVKVDFRHLKNTKDEKIFVLNEQGSKFFRKYIDSEKTELTDGEIGAWDKIDAEWADLNSSHGRFGFRLWRMPGAILRRGREFLEGSIDWVGLDYEVNPRSTIFEYSIEILGV
jgi:hypothetical protein